MMLQHQADVRPVSLADSASAAPGPPAAFAERESALDVHCYSPDLLRVVITAEGVDGPGTIGFLTF